MREVLNNQPARPGPRGEPGPQGPLGIAFTGGTSHWRPENLGYFGPHLPAFQGTGVMVYYRDVHFFGERVRDLVTTKNEKLIKINFNTCLRGTA